MWMPIRRDKINVHIDQYVIFVSQMGTDSRYNSTDVKLNFIDINDEYYYQVRIDKIIIKLNTHFDRLYADAILDFNQSLNIKQKHFAYGELKYEDGVSTCVLERNENEALAYTSPMTRRNLMNTKISFLFHTRNIYSNFLQKSTDNSSIEIEYSYYRVPKGLKRVMLINDNPFR
jgi:hypothetical protein